MRETGSVRFSSFLLVVLHMSPDPDRVGIPASPDFSPDSSHPAPDRQTSWTMMCFPAGIYAIPGSSGLPAASTRMMNPSNGRATSQGALSDPRRTPRSLTPDSAHWPWPAIPRLARYLLPLRWTPESAGAEGANCTSSPLSSRPGQIPDSTGGPHGATNTRGRRIG